MSAGLAAFAATAVVIELTPGPNMTWLALLAATEGRRAGFAAVAGVALGLGLMGAAAAFGLAALVTDVPAVYQALRWGGVAYLLWLAWEAWREAGAAEAAGPSAGAAVQFRRGLVTNLLNPKAAVFYLSVQPAFLPEAPHLHDVLLFSGVYVAIATLIHGGIVALAGGFTRFLGPPERERAIRRALALALVGVALWVLWKS